MKSSVRFEGDVIACAEEQASLLRKRRLDQLDREDLAEEIEGVCKSEQRDMVSRMAGLLEQLLKRQKHPGRQGAHL